MCGNSQLIADKVVEWSSHSRFQLNGEKCKELRISFTKKEDDFQPIVVNGKNLECITSANMLGVTISRKLTWNEHSSQVFKKASKRLYFFIQLKRLRLSCHELILFFCTCIRSILIYAAPLFHYALPMYLKNDLESVQKRALAIIYPSIEYSKVQSRAGFHTVSNYN